MKSTFTLIGDAFEIYFKKNNFVYLLKVTILQILIGIAAFFPLVLVMILMGGLSFLLLDQNSQNFGSSFFSAYGFLWFVIFVLISIASVWFLSTSLVAVSQVIKSEIISMKETLKLAWKRVWKLFLVNLLVGLIIFGGFVLFVVPGIIFAVWFSFARYYVIEGSPVIESLKKSKALVKGRFWRIVLRYIVFWALSVVIYVLLSFGSVLGTIGMIVFAPFFIFLPYLLFVDLKKLRNI